MYVSISDRHRGRLRFATDLIFEVKYCNDKREGVRKSIVKPKTEKSFQYETELDRVKKKLERIEFDLRGKNENYTLENIRAEYDLQIKKHTTPKEAHKNETLANVAFLAYIKSKADKWTPSTLKTIKGCFEHLKAYQLAFGELKVKDLNVQFWDKFRDKYLVDIKGFSNNSSNKYLGGLKQFSTFLKKENYIENDFLGKSFEYLKALDTYAVSLNEDEVETLKNFDFSNNSRLAKARDLFLLEVLSGQRFSDLYKLLDENNLTDEGIKIYQQKTGSFITVPLHPKLEDYFKTIKEKYTEGLPVISNQKFNEAIKDVCKEAGFNQIHSWEMQTGNKRTIHTDSRYNLISSHTGRRTFCTLSLLRGIEAEIVMKVSGHKSYKQFAEYIKLDTKQVNEAYQNY